MEPLAVAPVAGAPLADGEEIRRAMEYYDAMGWTDGLPVVPVTESYLAGFLAQTSRDPDETVFAIIGRAGPLRHGSVPPFATVYIAVRREELGGKRGKLRSAVRRW